MAKQTGNKAKKHDEFESVESALTATEAFIEKNQKQLITGVGILALLVTAFIAFNNMYFKPRTNEASNEMYKAQLYFARDSFELALQGDDFETIGFEGVSSKYSWTASGNLAKAYAGICLYNLGEYEEAIRFLSKFDGGKSYLGLSVTGLIGDCYVELDRPEKAVKFFKKAGEANNEALSPTFLKKAGFVYESLEQKDKALACYQIIKEKYADSLEGQDIEKYIFQLQ